MDTKTEYWKMLPQYASAAHKVNELKETMSRVVTSAEEMAKILQDVDVQEFQNRFQVQVSSALEDLKKEFSEPLPEDQTQRYRQQEIRIVRTLDMIEDALVIVSGFWKIPEVDVRMKFGDIKPNLKCVILITG